jgi:TRAP-type C4-dicarboxylate transport system permease small subunit
MSPEEKELLKRAVALGEENNDILRAMQRSQRLATVMRIIYWVVIIGSTIGAFYLIQPYIDSLKGVYGGANDIINSYQ